MDYKEIGKQLKKFREAQGLTQKKLAEKTHVTQGAISNIENGRNGPTIDIFVLILKVLGYAVRIEDGEITFYKVG